MNTAIAITAKISKIAKAISAKTREIEAKGATSSSSSGAGWKRASEDSIVAPPGKRTRTQESKSNTLKSDSDTEE